MIDLVDEMSSSSEVYKTATLLIDEYGEFAQTGAFIKADEMADKGDLVAHKTWLQVAKKLLKTCFQLNGPKTRSCTDSSTFGYCFLMHSYVVTTLRK